jgi:micrococcal nuclease
MGRALVAAALGLSLVACSNEAAAPEEENEVTIARVGDGDSLELASGERVRLVQIDAPELGEGECYGREATETLRALLPRGATVRLEADSRLDDADRFGRLLRYVHHDGRNVNLELVRRGAASVWFVGGDRGRYADDLLDAARDARADARGLWAACPGTVLDPHVPWRPISGAGRRTSRDRGAAANRRRGSRTRRRSERGM